MNGVYQKEKRPVTWPLSLPFFAGRVLDSNSKPWKEHNMDLINLVVVLIVVGVILWLVNSYVPMDAKIKQILNIVVVIAVVLWLLRMFVPLPGIHVGR
jgi:hypothetical protein